MLVPNVEACWSSGALVSTPENSCATNELLFIIALLKLTVIVCEAPPVMFLAYHIESVEVVSCALILVYVLPLESVTDVIAVVTPESSDTLTTIKLPDVVLAPNAADV